MAKAKTKRPAKRRVVTMWVHVDTYGEVWRMNDRQEARDEVKRYGGHAVKLTGEYEVDNAK